MFVRTVYYLGRFLTSIEYAQSDMDGCKFKKSYDPPLDLLQYRRENSAEYFLFGIAGGQEVDRNFS